MHTAFTLVALAALASAQVPLVSQRYNYASVPYKVDTFTGGRGPQSGVNRCNSTTLGQQSQCQTAIVNDVSDWCIWGLPEPNSEVGSGEGEAVAYCTTPTHGTRVIPPGAIRSVQFIKTPGYLQLSGTLDQTAVNIAANDYGGEMDSAGADQRGNPIGSLMFSNAWGNTTANSNYTQVIHWTNFMGANAFCLKACDPRGPNGARLCEHVYDRAGCAFNVPTKQISDGLFESCLGDNMDPVGVYTQNGQVLTYQQPPEGVAITYLPSIRTPASSSCTTYQSASLFSAAAAYFSNNGTVASSTSAAASTGPTSAAASATGSASGSPRSANVLPSPTQSVTGNARRTTTSLLAIISTALLALYA